MSQGKAIHTVSEDMDCITMEIVKVLQFQILFSKLETKFTPLTNLKPNNLFSTRSVSL